MAQPYKNDLLASVAHREKERIDSLAGLGRNLPRILNHAQPGRIDMLYSQGNEGTVSNPGNGRERDESPIPTLNIRTRGHP